MSETPKTRTVGLTAPSNCSANWAKITLGYRYVLIALFLALFLGISSKTEHVHAQVWINFIYDDPVEQIPWTMYDMMAVLRAADYINDMTQGVFANPMFTVSRNAGGGGWVSGRRIHVGGDSGSPDNQFHWSSLEVVMVHEIGHPMGVIGGFKNAGWTFLPAENNGTPWTMSWTNAPATLRVPANTPAAGVGAGGLVVPGYTYNIDPGDLFMFHGATSNAIWQDSWVTGLPANTRYGVPLDSGYYAGGGWNGYRGGIFDHIIMTRANMNSMYGGDTRPFFSEVEMAIMFDTGGDGRVTDISRFYGRTINMWHAAPIILTETDDWFGFDGDGMYGIGLHITADTNASHYSGRYNGFGITPIDGQGNHVTITGVDLISRGYAGVGIRVEGNDHTVIIDEGVLVASTASAVVTASRGNTVAGTDIFSEVMVGDGTGILLIHSSGTVIENRGTIASTGIAAAYTDAGGLTQYRESSGIWFSNNAASFTNSGTIYTAQLDALGNAIVGDDGRRVYNNIFQGGSAAMAANIFFEEGTRIVGNINMPGGAPVTFVEGTKLSPYGGHLADIEMFEKLFAARIWDPDDPDYDPNDFDPVFGTLTVSGNLTMLDGSILQVGLGDASYISDMVLVEGTATIGAIIIDIYSIHLGTYTYALMQADTLNYTSNSASFMYQGEAIMAGGSIAKLGGRSVVNPLWSTNFNNTTLMLTIGFEIADATTNIRVAWSGTENGPRRNEWFNAAGNADLQNILNWSGTYFINCDAVSFQWRRNPEDFILITEDQVIVADMTIRGDARGVLNWTFTAADGFAGTIIGDAAHPDALTYIDDATGLLVIEVFGSNAFHGIDTYDLNAHFNAGVRIASGTLRIGNGNVGRELHVNGGSVYIGAMEDSNDELDGGTGTLVISNNSLLNLYGGTVYVGGDATGTKIGGTLAGSGTVAGNVFVWGAAADIVRPNPTPPPPNIIIPQPGGAISPGDIAGQIGTLNIVGNLTMLPTSTLQVDLGGNNTSDLINVIGNAAIGAINIDLANLYASDPALGPFNAFRLVTATGNLSYVGNSATVRIQNRQTGAWLTLNPAPGGTAIAGVPRVTSVSADTRNDALTNLLLDIIINYGYNDPANTELTWTGLEDRVPGGGPQTGTWWVTTPASITNPTIPGGTNNPVFNWEENVYGIAMWYIPGDGVRFNLSGSHTINIENHASVVGPAVVAYMNVTGSGNWIFNGDIRGTNLAGESTLAAAIRTGALTVDSLFTGMVTLNGDNSFAGNITLNGGTTVIAGTTATTNPAATGGIFIGSPSAPTAPATPITTPAAANSYYSPAADSNGTAVVSGTLTGNVYVGGNGNLAMTPNFTAATGLTAVEIPAGGWGGKGTLAGDGLIVGNVSVWGYLAPTPEMPNADVPARPFVATPGRPGGTLAPGDYVYNPITGALVSKNIGTLNITGNLLMETGSTLRIQLAEIDPTLIDPNAAAYDEPKANDLVDVTGTATIEAGIIIDLMNLGGVLEAVPGTDPLDPYDSTDNQRLRLRVNFEEAIVKAGTLFYANDSALVMLQGELIPVPMNGRIHITTQTRNVMNELLLSISAEIENARIRWVNTEGNDRWSFTNINWLWGVDPTAFWHGDHVTFDLNGDQTVFVVGNRKTVSGMVVEGTGNWTFHGGMILGDIGTPTNRQTSLTGVFGDLTIDGGPGLVARFLNATEFKGGGDIISGTAIFINDANQFHTVADEGGMWVYEAGHLVIGNGDIAVTVDVYDIPIYDLTTGELIGYDSRPVTYGPGDAGFGGMIQGDIINNGAVTFNRGVDGNGDPTESWFHGNFFGGAPWLFGTGTLTKLGDGKVTMDGQYIQYYGDTLVQAGELHFATNLANPGNDVQMGNLYVTGGALTGDWDGTNPGRGISVGGMWTFADVVNGGGRISDIDNFNVWGDVTNSGTIARINEFTIWGGLTIATLDNRASGIIEDITIMDVLGDVYNAGRIRRIEDMWVWNNLTNYATGEISDITDLFAINNITNSGYMGKIEWMTSENLFNNTRGVVERVSELTVRNRINNAGYMIDIADIRFDLPAAVTSLNYSWNNHHSFINTGILAGVRNIDMGEQFELTTSGLFTGQLRNAKFRNEGGSIVVGNVTVADHTQLTGYILTDLNGQLTDVAGAMTPPAMTFDKIDTMTIAGDFECLEGILVVGVKGFDVSKIDVQSKVNADGDRFGGYAKIGHFDPLTWTTTSGGLVNVVSPGGMDMYDYSVDHRYVFLTADNLDVQGEFTMAASNDPLMRAVLGFDADSYWFEFVRSYNYTVRGKTKNQRAMGRYIDQLYIPRGHSDTRRVLTALGAADGGMSPLARGSVGSDVDPILYALDQISGPIYGTMMTASVQNVQLMHTTLGNVLRRDAINVLDDSQNQNYRGQVPYRYTRTNPKENYWGMFYGNSGSSHNDDNLNGYQHGFAGVLIGYDKVRDQRQRFGTFLSGGEGNLSSDVQDRMFSKEIMFGNYYRRDTDNGYLLMHTGFGNHNYDTKRRMTFGSNPDHPDHDPDYFINRTATSKHNAFILTGHLETGLRYRTGYLNLAPFIAAEYTLMAREGFREDGAISLNLSSDMQAYDSFRPMFGMKFDSASFRFRDGNASFYGNVAWMYEFETIKRHTEFSARFVDAGGQYGNTFTIWGNDPGRDWVVSGFGMNYDMNRNYRISAGYDAYANQRYVIHAANIGVLLQR